LSDVIERTTPEAIACHLYAADLPDPDLIIQTSGEIRPLGAGLAWTLRRRAEPQALVAPGGLSSIHPTFIPRGCLPTP
jgi:hypothetical protein